MLHACIEQNYAVYLLLSLVARDLTFEYIFLQSGKNDSLVTATDHKYTLLHASLLAMKVWLCVFMYYSISVCSSPVTHVFSPSIPILSPMVGCLHDSDYCL